MAEVTDKWLAVYKTLSPETQAEVKTNADALHAGIKDKRSQEQHVQFSDDMAIEAMMAILERIVRA